MHLVFIKIKVNSYLHQVLNINYNFTTDHIVFIFCRTLPNGTDISRIIEKDLVLGGYSIPAGVSITLVRTLFSFVLCKS